MCALYVYASTPCRGLLLLFTIPPLFSHPIRYLEIPWIPSSYFLLLGDSSVWYMLIFSFCLYFLLGYFNNFWVILILPSGSLFLMCNTSYQSPFLCVFAYIFERSAFLLCGKTSHVKYTLISRKIKAI